VFPLRNEISKSSKRVGGTKFKVKKKCRSLIYPIKNVSNITNLLLEFLLLRILLHLLELFFFNGDFFAMLLNSCKKINL
jgi:hypothetical protein